MPIDIPQTFGNDQPNHFGTDMAQRDSLRAGGFVGSTRQGGSCNVDRIALIPHCNGTHTEHAGHIVDEFSKSTWRQIPSWMSALVLSVKPMSVDQAGHESYRPPLDSSDRVILRRDLEAAWTTVAARSGGPPTALVVRTLPNSERKLSSRYGEGNEPPFLTIEALQWVVERGFDHLLVDFPSIDRMRDEGLLTNHHLFWNVPERTHTVTPGTKWQRTITEMIFVPNSLQDGLYLLNLQLPDWNTDAVPARPLLFELFDDDSPHQ